MQIKHENLGTTNKNKVSILSTDGNTILLEIWFSYETPVAFAVEGEDALVRQNEWSTTTGKFLNELEPDKAKRLPGSSFHARLDEALTKFKVKI